MMRGNFMDGAFPGFMIIIIGLAILDVYLKGLSLWRSSRNGQTGWFIALLIINSLGILPAIYLLTNPEKKGKSSK